jgi:translation initiation factor IF-3
MIRIPQVRVVDEEGLQLGVMPTQQALGMAQDRGLDLVEVAPMASPPVVRFLDFGQYKYELTKRDKEAKRKQRAVEFKEVRLTPKIGSGDFETKVNRAIEFLEDGDRIKVTVRFRGRELTHPEIGRNLLARFGDRVKEHATIGRMPSFEGKSMFMTLTSVHKPKVHEHRSPAAGKDAQPAIDNTEQAKAENQAQGEAQAPAEQADEAPAAAIPQQTNGEARPAAEPKQEHEEARPAAGPPEQNTPARPAAEPKQAEPQAEPATPGE